MRRSVGALLPSPAIGRTRPFLLHRSVPVGVVAGLLVLGLVAGSLYLAPSVAALGLLAVGVGVPLFLLVWFRPEFGLLAVLFLTSSFIPPDFIDVRLPIGGLDVRDLVLLGMLGILVFQGLIRRNLTAPWWPVAAPLLVFLSLALFSTVDALVFQGVESNWALGEFRALMFFSAFFLTVWTITQREQLYRLLAGLFLLADLTAAIVILQQVLGPGNRLLAVMSSNVWLVWSWGDPSAGFGAVRIVPPGHVLVFAMTIAAFCLMVYAWHNRGLRAFFLLQFVYLNVGLLLTYTRAQWIASAMALGLVFVFLPVVEKNRLVRYSLIVFLVLLPLLSLFGAEFERSLNNSQFFEMLSDRVFSIFTPEETLESFSLGWRFFENEEALDSISRHPLIGVGLGNVYRDPSLFLGEIRSGYLRFTRFVHNGYLYITVKMGVLGLMAFLWFCTAFLVLGWKTFLGSSDALLRYLMLAFLAGFVGVLVWSLTQPHFLQVEGAVVLGLMTGLVASIRQVEKS